MKKEILFILLIGLFLIACTPEISEEELNKELEELSEDELIYVLTEEEDTSLVGEAARSRLFTLRKIVDNRKVILSPSLRNRIFL